MATRPLFGNHRQETPPTRRIDQEDARGLKVSPSAETPGLTMRDVYASRYLSALDNLRVELRIITPDWAREVLEKNNIGNRPLLGSWRTIMAAIKRGAWHVNGECVIFSRAGRLLNGQHRLQSIVASCESVPVLVIYGIDEDAFTTYDQGRKRSGADVLSMLGQENCTTLAATLLWIKRWEERTPDGCPNQSVRSIGNDQLPGLIEEYPGAIQSVSAIRKRYGKQRLMPPALAAFLHFLFTDYDKDAAEKFFDAVLDGIGVAKDSHEDKLRKALVNCGTDTLQGQIHIAALCVKTFNWIRRGERVRDLLRWTRVGESRENFPEIHS